MLELNASGFLGAATALARLHQIFSQLSSAYQEPLIAESVAIILTAAQNFRGEAEAIGARLAVVSADRFIARLEENPCPLNVGQAVHAMNDMESRFADHFSEIKLFTLTQQESIFLLPADDLVDKPGFSLSFPSTSFEVEEAAKCMALGRFTAAVFHAMRMLELGIRALAKRLGIPDPTKPAEKNWGSILGSIQKKIDETWPPKDRMPESEGAAFAALYATLDAVRNPWRNSTMHVETIYAPHEAIHIVRCVAFFMTKLSSLCDESGNLPASDEQIPGLEAG